MTYCSQDRRKLYKADLRPLSRYMRRDLDELKVKCVHYKDGCAFVSSLEKIGQHEVTCEYKLLINSNDASCKTGSQSAAAQLVGCRSSASHALVPVAREQKAAEHNNYSCSGFEQLKCKLDECRTMFEKAMEEHKREVDVRLDAQRRHFVLKENGMQQQIDLLKSDNVRFREVSTQF